MRPNSKHPLARMTPNPSVETSPNSVPPRAGNAGFAHSAPPARGVPLSGSSHLKR